MAQHVFTPAKSGKGLAIRPHPPNAKLRPAEARDYMKAHAELVLIADLLMNEPVGVGLVSRVDGHVYWLQELDSERVDLATAHMCHDGWISYDDLMLASERELKSVDLANWAQALAIAFDERRFVPIESERASEAYRGFAPTVAAQP